LNEQESLPCLLRKKERKHLSKQKEMMLIALYNEKMEDGRIEAKRDNSQNGEWENRTPDLVHAKHALYQLS
jgi:hypothetical protein